MHTKLDKILISLSIFIIAFTFFSPLKNVQADETDLVQEKANFYIEIGSLDDAISHYHETQNNLLNSRMEKFIEEVDRANLKPVNSEEECTDDNFTAFCTATVALKEYDAFQKAMDTHYRFIIPQNIGSNTALDVAIDTSVQENRIDSELSYSSEALKLSIKAYGEFLKFYPLHKSYQTTTKLLQQYNDKLENIRSNIDSYPIKFIDAQTTQCI